MTNNSHDAHHESDKTEPIIIESTPTLPTPAVTDNNDAHSGRSTASSAAEQVSPALQDTPAVQDYPGRSSKNYFAPSPAESAGTASVTTAAAVKRPASVRFTTIVWGLIVAFIGAIVVLAALGISFDLQLVAIIALGVSGLVLLVGAITRGLRS